MLKYCVMIFVLIFEDKRITAGAYAAATRLAALILLGLHAVNTIVAPLISQLYAQGRIQELQRMAAFAARMIFAITLPVSLGVIIFGLWVLGLFGPGFTIAYPALVILSVSQIISALSGSVGFLTIQTGHQRVAAYVFGGSAALNSIKWDTDSGNGHSGRSDSHRSNNRDLEYHFSYFYPEALADQPDDIHPGWGSRKPESFPRFLGPPVENKPLSPEFRRELIEEFREDVNLLSRILNRDLRYWFS